MTEGSVSTIPVDVNAIERQLVEIRKSADFASPGGLPAARTAVLSLVAYAPDAETLRRVQATVEALVQHHPSRTIVVYVDASLPASHLSASVSARCRRTGSGMHVCNELIVVECHPAARRRVPNVVLPLLLPDLPAMVWWPGELPDGDPFLFDLLEPINRLIVDTGEFDHVERALKALAELRNPAGRLLDLSDLSWVRLRPWRELIAQFWDVPAWRAHVRRLDRVEIEVGRPLAGQSNRSQALLLIGWLTSRLGWRPSSSERRADGYRFVAHRGRREVEITVTIRPAERAGLRVVRLEDARGRQTGTFEIAAGDGESAVATVRRGTGEPIVRVRRLESLAEAELLGIELDTASADVVFEEALDAAVRYVVLNRVR